MNSLVKKAYFDASANIDKIKQVIMLYEGAITFLKQAKQAIIEKDYEERYNKLDRVSKILTGLRDSLDFDYGEDISRILSEWYDGAILRVLSINNSDDLNMCDVCIKNLSDMKDSWEEAEKTSKENSDNKKSSEFSGENQDIKGNEAIKNYSEIQTSISVSI